MLFAPSTERRLSKLIDFSGKNAELDLVPQGRDEGDATSMT